MSEADNKSRDLKEDASTIPSPNLLITALSRSHVARQDDLRAASDEISRIRVEGLEKLAEMRFKYTEQIAELQNRCLGERAALTASYEDKLTRAEAGRIDAIRAVDVNAVSVASQRAGDQATALASQVASQAEVVRNQVATSAEALRALVATTASAALANQQQQFTALSTRITTLEQAGAEGKGKQSFSDPAFTELLSEVRNLKESGRQTAGVQQGVGLSWQVIVGIIGLSGGLFVAYQASTHAPVSPQVIYAPAPTVSALPPATK
jgi:hypothetical protein